MSSTNLMNNNGVSSWPDTYTYSSDAVAGVSVLVVAATISLFAVLGMLTAIIITSFKTKHAFIRSNLGAYFISLVFAEMIQATGSLMSSRWVSLGEVEAGSFCAAQGALKNAGNVSTAIWSMIIAFHTFTLIFLKTRVPSWAFYTTLVTAWLFVGFIVLLGPAALETPEKGPFWGISGYWCWISGTYRAEQFSMEYLFMFMTAVISVILYSLIFLRLRGNIEGTGFRMIFCRARTPWLHYNNVADPQIERVGKTMLLYPLCYVVLVLPIAACRWSEIYGKDVPFGLTIFADTVFLLSGLVNATLYCTTRQVAPIKSMILSLDPRRSHTNEKLVSESFQVGTSGTLAPLHPIHVEKGLRTSKDLTEIVLTPHPYHSASNSISMEYPLAHSAAPQPSIQAHIVPPHELEARLAAEDARLAMRSQKFNQ